MLDTAMLDALARRPPIWAAGAQDWWDFTRSGRAKRGVGAMPVETRASDGWAEDKARLLIKRSANTRSMAGAGLLTYPTRTNGVRNNTMVGAAAGSPGTIPTNWTVQLAGLTRTVVGSGTTTFGIPYIDLRFSGTTSGTQFQILPESNAVITASNGQTWAASVAGAELISGTLAGITGAAVGYNVNNGAGTYLTTPVQQSVSLDSSGSPPTQKVGVGTIANASTAYVQPFFLFTCTNGAAVDFTVRIYAPQIEQGSFASPPILTGGSAVTASGPQQVIDIGSRAALGVGGIIQIDIRQPAVSGASPRVIEINDGTNNNYVSLYRRDSTGCISLAVANSGLSQGNVDTNYTFAAGLVTLAFAAGTDYMMARAVGVSAPIADTTVSYPTTLSKACPGGAGYNPGSNIYSLSKRLALWYGPMSQHFFDNVLWPKAQLLAQVA